jgi:predicted DNA binding CopG/RHH family protein
MNADLDHAITEQWETGQLGRDEAHVVVVDEATDAAMDKAMAMKLVTMRLPIQLIEILKLIAAHHGIAYQPMIRDLLGRFAESELKNIAFEIDQSMRKVNASTDGAVSKAVDGFIEREAQEHLAKCA